MSPLSPRCYLLGFASYSCLPKILLQWFGYVRIPHHSERLCFDPSWQLKKNPLLKYRNRINRWLQPNALHSHSLKMRPGHTLVYYGSIYCKFLPHQTFAANVEAFCLAVSVRVKPAFSGVGMFSLLNVFCTCYQHNGLTLKDFEPVYKIQWSVYQNLFY